MRYFSMWLGPETDPPITAGSLANVLWQRGNDRLAEVGTPPTRYTVSLKDLAQLDGFDASEEKLVLGATVPVTDTDMGIDVDVRIVGITYDLANHMNTEVTLEKTVRLASKDLMNPRYSVRRPEAGQTTTLTGPEVRPAVREDGAYRSDAPADSSGGVVTPTEYTA
jgi:hypothetical protein